MNQQLVPMNQLKTSKQPKNKLPVEKSIASMSQSAMNQLNQIMISDEDIGPEELDNPLTSDRKKKKCKNNEDQYDKHKKYCKHRQWYDM